MQELRPLSSPCPPLTHSGLLLCGPSGGAEASFLNTVLPQGTPSEGAGKAGSPTLSLSLALALLFTSPNPH